MIGNTIIFRKYERTPYGIDWSKEPVETEGIVVDAYTKVTGDMKGSSAFGFGEVTGETKSKRMYKVQYQYQYSSLVFYDDIEDRQLIRVVKLANVPAAEEKFISDNKQIR